MSDTRTGSMAEALSRTLDAVDDVRDVLEGRVTGPGTPAWCATRGLDGFLLSLGEAELARAETEGLGVVVAARRDAPTSLVDLCLRVDALTALPGTSASELVPPSLRGASARKRAQVAALAALVGEAALPVQRIVDVGAGHGHLTRALAEALGASAIGLEREVDRVRRATALTSTRSVRFERWDAREATLTLCSTDLAVGLHACGELSDLIVERAARAGASALVVSCCLQKISPDARPSLSSIARARPGGFSLTRSILGLSNVAPRAHGVESSMRKIMLARETRHALRLLLQGRGLTIQPGEETRGINRRRMAAGLAHVAPLALARRELPVASEKELADATARARVESPRMRRLELPRSMLGRLVEAAVAFDRATRLEEAGHRVVVARAFDVSHSPRNVVIVGRPERAQRH